jgi:hypothetical protein
VCEVGFILSSVGAWYLLSGKSKKIDRAEVLNMVQASYELAGDKDQMAENLLMLLGFRPKEA